MGFNEDFQASIESLPAILHRHYGTMRDLDKSLQGVQRQNEQRCEQEIQEIRRGIESGNIIPDRSHIRFSDEALDEQKHCIRIADEKVALATLAYDLALLNNTIEICCLITSEQTRGGDWKHHKDCVHTSPSIAVDEQICQLDQYMRKLESLRHEKELAVSGGASALNSDGTPRSARATESSRGGRKKTKVVTPLEQPSMDFELPVDPNEPTYCICNQVSWGEMIACDNPDCKIEWFHFQCVGLKEHPKGKWYCSSCVGLPKRRKGK